MDTLDPLLEAWELLRQQRDLSSTAARPSAYDPLLEALPRFSWNDVFAPLSARITLAKQERERQKALLEAQKQGKENKATPSPQPQATPQPQAAPQAQATPQPQAASRVQAAPKPPEPDVLRVAESYLNRPYVFGGGRGTDANFDCSSFVSTVYASQGKRLTPYTDAMYSETMPVAPQDARPGDLVFYVGYDPSQPGTRFPHVAIYAGGDKVIDASTRPAPGLPNGGVAYRPLTIPGYTPTIRRVP